MPARNLIKATNARFAKSLEEAMGCNDELVELTIRQIFFARNNCSWFNNRLCSLARCCPRQRALQEKPSDTEPTHASPSFLQIAEAMGCNEEFPKLIILQMFAARTNCSRFDGSLWICCFPGTIVPLGFQSCFFVKILTRSNPEWVRPIGSPLPPLES